MDTMPSRKLTREGAMKVLEAAVSAAEAKGRSARTDKAELYSIPICLAKARSAALTRFPSGKKSPTGNERDDHHALAITLAAGPGSFVSVPGGIPLFSQGECIGAVGVSGAGHSDVKIAEIAASTVEAITPKKPGST